MTDTMTSQNIELSSWDTLNNRILSTVCVHVFSGILKMYKQHFPKHSTWLVFVREAQCVFCKK
jgi:hypothetical protein